jgi:hypothetical protein
VPGHRTPMPHHSLFNVAASNPGSSPEAPFDGQGITLTFTGQQLGLVA